MKLIEKPEVNTLEVFPNGGGTCVWVKEMKNTGMRNANEAELLNAAYASGYIPRSRKATLLQDKSTLGHPVFKMHAFRITKL